MLVFIYVSLAGKYKGWMVGVSSSTCLLENDAGTIWLLQIMLRFIGKIPAFRNASLMAKGVVLSIA